MTFYSTVLRALQLLINMEPLDRFKWGFQQNVPLLMRFQSNKKPKMSHVQLPTDSPRLHHIYKAPGSVNLLPIKCINT